MSVLTVRGGTPHVFRDSAVNNTSGRDHALPFWCLYLIIRVTGNPCKLYFTQADFDADANYVLVPIAAATTPHGEWAGPVEAEKVWLRGSGGNSGVELVAFQRRG
jgi:hypothetical protein